MAAIGRARETFAALSGGAALLTRLFVGGFFVNTGLAKIRHLGQFEANFAGWHIPYPQFSALLSAYTEFGGGLLTVVGLGTRLVAIPMIFNMLVALFRRGPAVQRLVVRRFPQYRRTALCADLFMADNHRRRLAESRRLAEAGAALIALFRRSADTSARVQQMLQPVLVLLIPKKGVDFFERFFEATRERSR